MKLQNLVQLCACYLTRIKPLRNPKFCYSKSWTRTEGIGIIYVGAKLLKLANRKLKLQKRKMEKKEEEDDKKLILLHFEMYFNQFLENDG